jgi:hypothetical protein
MSVKKSGIFMKNLDICAIKMEKIEKTPQN